MMVALEKQKKTHLWIWDQCGLQSESQDSWDYKKETPSWINKEIKWKKKEEKRMKSNYIQSTKFEARTLPNFFQLTIILLISEKVKTKIWNSIYLMNIDEPSTKHQQSKSPTYQDYTIKTNRAYYRRENLAYHLIRKLFDRPQWQFRKKKDILSF